MTAKRNYHMMVGPTDESRTRWGCDYCGAEDSSYEKLIAGECTHVYEACEHCGGCDESNECKPDCPGIAAILADPEVYVVGTSATGGVMTADEPRKPEKS